jgi:hypothetical protein
MVQVYGLTMNGLDKPELNLGSKVARSMIWNISYPNLPNSIPSYPFTVGHFLNVPKMRIVRSTSVSLCMK